MRLTYKINDKEYAPCKNTGWKTFDKLGQLEDIEDELGIDLITLFKALLNGIYYRGAYGTNDYGKIVYKEHPTILFDVENKLYCFKPTFFDFVYLKYYGKTWALTKEELELL